MDLKETRLETALVYEGDFMRVHKDRVLLPDGAVRSREYINHPGAVAVLAMLDNGNLVLERQFRYAPQREFIELPAGKIDYGEDILLTAQRELLEETGYAARGLAHEGRKLDDGEFLEVFELSLSEAIEWIRLGRIDDSKTIVGLFWLEKHLNGWQS